MMWTPEKREARKRARGLALEMRAGGATLQAIADALASGGHQTMRGGPWYLQAVVRLLAADLPEPSPKYDARHCRVRAARGDASEQRCIECGKQAFAWATIDGTDGMSPEDYQPMCQPCHMAYDGFMAPKRAETRAKMSAYASNRTPEHQENLNKARTGAKRSGQALENMRRGQQRRREREQEARSARQEGGTLPGDARAS